MNNLECEEKELSIGFRNPHLVYLYSTDTRRAKVHRGVCVCVRERERERKREKDFIRKQCGKEEEVVVVLEKMCETVRT